MQTIASRQARVVKAGVRSSARPCKAISVRVRAVAEVEVPKERRTGPLSAGGNTGSAGKDASAAVKAKANAANAPMRIVDGKFSDFRWINGEGQGRWDLAKFPKTKDGETDWDKVIDAEIARRALLEATPIPSTNEDPVNWDTSEIPTWAWVKRFHLPEAEKLNGRAAMVGYLFAGIVDLMSGAGLVDQQESFLGKLALHVVVFAILIVRNTTDIQKFKGLLDEATFYDKQWNATWEDGRRPSEQKQQ